VARGQWEADFRGQLGDREGPEAARAALPLDEPLPGRLDAARKRAHHAQPCDDDTSHRVFHRVRSGKVKTGPGTSLPPISTVNHTILTPGRAKAIAASPRGRPNRGAQAFADCLKHVIA